MTPSAVEGVAREYLRCRGVGGDALATARERLATAALPHAIRITRTRLQRFQLPQSVIEADSVAGLALDRTIRKYKKPEPFGRRLNVTICTLIIDELRLATSWDRVRKFRRRPDSVSLDGLQPNERSRLLTLPTTPPEPHNWAQERVAKLFKLPMTTTQHDVLSALLRMGGSQAAAAVALGVSASAVSKTVCQIRALGGRFG